jgi:uncharacterized membrane protein YedE/YeeE
MKSSLRIHVIYGLLGLLMGITLSAIGFADYDQLFKMFTFTDPRMLLAFASGVAIAAGVFGLLHVIKFIRLEKKHYHPGTIMGSILFGYGWVMCGACPGIALIQLGQGKLPALLTLIGIFVGVRSYRFLHERYFQWDTGTCGI